MVLMQLMLILVWMVFLLCFGYSSFGGPMVLVLLMVSFGDFNGFSGLVITIVLMV